MIYDLEHPAGRELTFHGEKYLYFGGTAYLGAQTNGDFQTLLTENIRRFGTNMGTSRRSNVRLKLYEAVENNLAARVGSERALTLSSGFLAAQLVCASLYLEGHQSFYAPHTHAALHYGKLTPFPTYDALADAVCHHLSHKPSKRPVVFLDSIDFSASGYPNYEGLRKLPLQELILVVDDSHGFGLVGEDGAGVYRRISGLEPGELILCCSLGKALGIQAGAVFGMENRLLMLAETDFFAGASPAPPAHLFTMDQAWSMYGDMRNRLMKNIKTFTALVEQPELFSGYEAYPVFSFSDPHLSAHLESRKIVITNFRYPSADATMTSRIVLSASHQTEDIKALSIALNTAVLP